MIFQKQSMEDEFFLSHLENQTYLKWNGSWKVKNIHTYVTKEEIIPKYVPQESHQNSCNSSNIFHAKVWNTSTTSNRVQPIEWMINYMI